jgi:hypothetical protein
MKILTRALVFVAGVALLIFGWHKAHNVVINAGVPGGANAVRSSELLVVVGGLIALMAFLPSSDTLGRLAAPKRRKVTAPAHFRRRRRT